MNQNTQGLSREVMHIFREVGREIARLQLSTGLRCSPGCGLCCESPHVEATVLESLPLAREIYRRGEEEAILNAIEERNHRRDPVCVLYRPDTLIPGQGRCAYYDFRPMLCRLFGFAARKEKYGNLEFCTCKIIKGKYPEAVSRVEGRLAEGPEMTGIHEWEPPVYQDISMRMAGIDPGTGFARYPINQAIKQALARAYWENSRPSPTLLRGR